MASQPQEVQETQGDLSDQEVESAVEGILFASGEPVHLDRICLALSMDRQAVEAVLRRLRDYYAFERRGIRLLQLEDSWQLCSAPDHAEIIRKAFEIRKPAKLSPPALEALTIVAYYQPTTRAYVDKLRGVDSAYTMGLLQERGLIEACGRLQVPGRPLLYRTTEQFLRAFHLSSLDDLPPLPEGGIVPAKPKISADEPEPPEDGEREPSPESEKEGAEQNAPPEPDPPAPPVMPVEIGPPPREAPEDPVGPIEDGSIDAEPMEEPSEEDLIGDDAGEPENTCYVPPMGKGRKRPPRRRRKISRRRRLEKRRSRREVRREHRHRRCRRQRRSPPAEPEGGVPGGESASNPAAAPERQTVRPGSRVRRVRRSAGRWFRCLLFGCWLSWPWWPSCC